MAHVRTDTNSKTTASTSRAPDSSALSAFIGEWRTEGEQLAGPVGPAEKIRATQKFEWLQGENFLIHRFDGQVGSSPACCIEIIGCDRDTGSCRAQTFYNNGLTNVWDVELQGERWRFDGDWNMGGRSMKVRASITLEANARAMRTVWEYSSDGRKWDVFWTLEARKVIPH